MKLRVLACVLALPAVTLDVAMLHGATPPAATPADLVFVDGAVYTVDAARSWASALAVTGDRIAYVGDEREARELVGPHTRLIDLKHRMLLPGFQDSHVHPAEAPNPADSLDLHGLVQREQLIERIRQFARTHPAKPWIAGEGWDEAAFLPSGQPTRQMLDAAVPDRPAFLVANSGHEAWANTRALAAAHVSAATPDPINGRIERNSQGEPTGLLLEEAQELVRRVVPPPTPEERVADLSAALGEMSRLGITALEDAAADADIQRAYRTLDQAGKLRQRTHLCQLYRPTEDDAAQLRRFVAQRAALAGRRLRADCVKIFLDGAYGSHSVVLLQPYSDEPARFGKGKLFVDPQRLERLVRRLDAAGFQVHMHAIGDGAVHAGLDAFAAARRANGFRDSRDTLAHLSLIADADVARFRTLGVIANMTPLWSVDDPWETIFAPRLFGPGRFPELYRTRTLLEAGVILVWGSDWPVTGVSPLEGLETAITHRYPGGKDPEGREDHAWKPEEHLSLEQAIVAYTSAGAYLLHDELARGSLVAGKAADLVVLGRNLFETPPLEIHNVPVDMTIVAGEVIFERARACIPLGQKLVSTLTVTPLVVRVPFDPAQTERQPRTRARASGARCGIEGDASG
jgi:predicted amidohydrolase YtcJ